MQMKKKLIKIGGVLMKCLLLFIFGWPFFWLISTSLQTVEEVNRVTPTFFPAVPQFINYAEAWGNNMWIYLKNSLIVVVGSILIQLVVMVPAAYAFAKHEFKGKKLLFGSVLIALMMPTQITFLPIYLMMSDWGVINSLIPLILPAMTNAFGIFLLRQYFMQIDNELLEAAKLDGASEGRVIMQIMVPLSKPAFATIILFCFVGTWNDYFWPLVMTNLDEFRTLPVGIARLSEMEGMHNWHVVMAGNVILLLPIILVYLFASKQIMQSFAHGEIK